MYNPPAVTNHQDTILPPIEPSKAPARSGSVLASILESISLDSRVGQVFFILDHKGTLVRRGVVVSESTSSFIVSYCDVFGILVNRKTVRKADSANWKWFDSIDEANAAYDRRYPNVVPNNLVN